MGHFPPLLSQSPNYIFYSLLYDFLWSILIRFEQIFSNLRKSFVLTKSIGMKKTEIAKSKSIFLLQQKTHRHKNRWKEFISLLFYKFGALFAMRRENKKSSIESEIMFYWRKRKLVRHRGRTVFFCAKENLKKKTNERDVRKNETMNEIFPS